MDTNQPKTKKDSKKQKRNPSEKSGLSLSKFRPSVLLDAFTKWFCMLLTTGMIANALTAYTAEENALKRLIHKRKKKNSIHHKESRNTRGVTAAAEIVMLAKPLKRLRYILLKSPFSYYTDMVWVFAFFALVSNFLVLLFKGLPSISVNISISGYVLPSLYDYFDFNRSIEAWVYVGLIVLFLIFPLPIRSRSFHDVKTGSVLLSAFFERILGAKGELTEELQNRNSDLEKGARRSSGLRAVLLLLAVGAGILSAFVSPLRILLVPVLLSLVVIIIRTPEAGLILSVFFLPISSLFGNYNQLYTVTAYGTTFLDLLKAIGLPTLVLVSLILLTGISYLIKLLRKKRLFHFGLFDFVILILGACVVFCGIYPHTTRTSMAEAILMVIFLCLYFLIVNLLRSELWIERLMKAVLSSSFFMLSATIYVYFFGIPDLALFSSAFVKGSVGNVSLLGGEAFTGAFLVLLFPLALSSVFSARSSWQRFFGVMCVPEIFFLAFHLTSKVALVFCILELCAYAILSTYKALYMIPIAAAVPGLAYRLIPNGKSLHTFLVEFFTQNFAQKIYLWDACLSSPTSISFSGFGYGMIRFSTHIAPSSEFGSAGFWMRTLFGMGILGIVAYALFLFFFGQMCLEEVRAARGSHLKYAVAGGMVAILSLFLYGAFMPIFVDFRMTFLFWICVGVTAAFRQTSHEKRNSHSLLREQPMSERSADIIVY
jgi:hypothetical protein